MRVTPRMVFVVPDFYPSTSGYASACTGFVEALSKRPGVSLDVITFADLAGRQEVPWRNVHVHRLRRPRMAGKVNVLGEELCVRRRVRSLLRAHPDALIVFETAEFPIAALLTVRRIGGSQVICRVHGCSETEWVLYRRRPLYMLKRWPTTLLFRRLRLITATSPFYIRFVQERFLGGDPLLIASKQYDVVPNIVPIDPATGERPNALPAFARDGGQGVLLISLGRMDRHGELQKNFSRLLMAIARVDSSAAGRPLRLALIGQGTHRPALQRLACELGIADRVTFHEALPNDAVQALQRRAHGVILASTFEGQSAFAVEALANGAGLLLSNVGGLRDLVEPGVNGVLFDPLDPWDMAEKIREYVLGIVPTIERARQASRDRFASRFDPEAIIERFLRDVEAWLALDRATRATAERSAPVRTDELDRAPDAPDVDSSPAGEVSRGARG